jgi:RNA polymerase sigma factor (sigma-70 family)
MDGFVAPAPRPRLALPRRSLRTANDDRLVAQIRRGDGPDARAAFEVLYDRHHRGILAFCRHMLGSFEEAEDAVQHTFSSAYRALLRDDRHISLRAWLYAIARNRCLSMLAARREHVALDDVDGMLPSTTGLALEVEQRNDLRELLADMQRLPEDQRAALVLAELEAHSHKEIGEILGVPPAKVKALVFQARESLMIRRQARDTSCAEIREQLSVLRGGALRRRELRRHIESCEGCRMFEAEVRRQRAGMAVLLPVAPTLALKNTTLASAFATTSTAAAGVGTIGGGGAAAGLALGTKAMGMKALAVLAVAGSAGGGGYVAVTQVVDSRRAPSPPPAQSVPAEQDGVSGSAAPAAASPVIEPKARSSAGAAASGAAGTSAPVSGAERSAERSAGRASDSTRGNSSTAQAGKTAKPATAKTSASAHKSATGSRASAKADAQRAAAKARARRAAELRAAAERRARALREGLARKRAAEAARLAKEKAAAQQAPAVTPAPQSSTRCTPTCWPRSTGPRATSCTSRRRRWSTRSRSASTSRSSS